MVTEAVLWRTGTNSEALGNHSGIFNGNDVPQAATTVEAVIIHSGKNLSRFKEATQTSRGVVMVTMYAPSFPSW